MKKFVLVALVLVLLLVGLGATLEKSIVLPATDDAYIVSDVSTTDDPQGLRDKNYGSLDFIKVWYAWKVQQTEQVISLGLVKFDLSPLKDKDVQSATLQLFAQRTDLPPQAARLVDVQLVQGGWSEKDVTFNTKPSWDVNAIATTAVYGAGAWYSWDVTGAIQRQAKTGDASFVLGLRTMQEKMEEQVLFSPHEVGTNAPRLIVTYRSSAGGVPWYVWPPVGVVGAGLIFVVGFWLARRRLAGRPAPGESAPESQQTP